MYVTTPGVVDPGVYFKIKIPGFKFSIYPMGYGVQLYLYKTTQVSTVTVCTMQVYRYNRK